MVNIEDTPRVLLETAQLYSKEPDSPEKRLAYKELEELYLRFQLLLMKHFPQMQEETFTRTWEMLKNIFWNIRADTEDLAKEAERIFK